MAALCPFSSVAFNCVFICKHLLFVQNKKLIEYIFFVHFLKFYANQKLFDTTFEILIIHKPSLGSCEVLHKIWA